MNYKAIQLALSLLLLAGCDASNEQAAKVEMSPIEQDDFGFGSSGFGTWGFDLTAIDESTKPGDDFFRFVNGAWLDKNEIPAERTSYGVSLIVHERAQERVRAIIEELGAENSAIGTPEQKVGDYYASWMDVSTVNKLGISPLRPDLERISRIEDVAALLTEFGQQYFIKGISPFSAGLGIDPKNPDSYNINIGLSGLGLPERDYYLEESERFIKIRQEYLTHIAEMLSFAKIKEPDNLANAILELETNIAQLQWVRSDRRDRDKTYNPSTVKDLQKNYPGIDWQIFLKSSGHKSLAELNINHPNTLLPLIKLVTTTSLDTWKAYLSYHMISNHASLLSEEIDNANFNFWGTIVNGREKPLERWKRGVARVGAKNGLGEALGQIYVSRHFDESSKEQMLTLVENLRKAYLQRINAITWMEETTKVEARAKLAAFRAKIGYPDKWLDLEAISIDKAKLFKNARTISRFFEDFDVARLGNPTDKEEWFMMPQTVNAYYLANFNEIVFPAAILSAPYFDPNADPAINYGAIGAIIGHEMGHGFDDQGSKYDARGIKRNWWTDTDRAAFEQRTSLLSQQFSQFEAIPGHFVDGDFTMGENIGDLGGIAVALKAYRLSLQGEEPVVIDGFTGTQRFFLSYGQSWRNMVREEATLQRLKSDPHSPARFRVNGIVRNTDEWYEAFKVTEDDELFLPPEERVSIW